MPQAKFNSLPTMQQGIYNYKDTPGPRPMFAKGQMGRVNNVGDEIEEMETRAGDK